jgi:hypothetical protein
MTLLSLLLLQGTQYSEYGSITTLSSVHTVLVISPKAPTIAIP